MRRGMLNSVLWARRRVLRQEKRADSPCFALPALVRPAGCTWPRRPPLVRRRTLLGEAGSAAPAPAAPWPTRVPPPPSPVLSGCLRPAHPSISIPVCDLSSLCFSTLLLFSQCKICSWWWASFTVLYKNTNCFVRTKPKPCRTSWKSSRMCIFICVTSILWLIAYPIFNRFI